MSEIGERFLDLGKVRTKVVDHPVLGKLAVREMEFTETESYSALRASADIEQSKRAMPWVIAQCTLSGIGGERVWADTDVAAIGKMRPEVVTHLLMEILRFSDADPEAVTRAGEPSAETSTPASS